MSNAYHGTLVAATVTTVTIDVTDANQLYIHNLDTSAQIYVTVGTGVAPVSAATGSILVRAASSRSWPTAALAGSVIVKMISAGTPAYSVDAV